MPKILVLGASSEIAQEALKLLAKDGWDLVLACRNPAALENFLQVLAAVNPQIAVKTAAFDALDPKEEQLKLWQEFGASCQALFCAAGMLGDQEKAKADPLTALQCLKVNFTGLVPIIQKAAHDFAERGGGRILVISSAAGARGRSSNYVYGAAKAGLNAYLEGLSQSLYCKGVAVTIVMPGFVKTKMIAFKHTPWLLTASPKTVGRICVRAFKAQKAVVYAPAYWRFILWALKLIPPFIYRHLSKL